MFKKIFITILLSLSLIVGLVFIYSLKMIYFGEKKPGGEKIIMIKEGQGANEISSLLFREGLVKNKFIFEIYLWLKNLEDKLQAGEYRLKSGMSIKELVNILVKGIGSREREIKVIEGWTVKDIADYLEREGITKKEVFMEAVINYKEGETKYEFLKDKAKEATLEGFLFPDTYRIYYDAKAEEIIQKMLDNFNRKLTIKMREDIKKSGRTIFEVVTLASILEKEVPNKEDQAKVADLFYRRLKVGIPLQADSTVNYITGKKVNRISKEDAKIDSPYNTYKYRGLPPGPISNPGLGAIEAAIYPIKNNYWYFLTTPDGQVIFSKTLEEHNAAKARYLK